MFINPYQTTTGKRITTDVSLKALNTAIATGYDYIKPLLNGTIQILPNDEIKPFYHPLPVMHKKEICYAIDLSVFMRDTTNGPVVKDKAVYALQVMRAGLTSIISRSSSMYYTLPDAVVSSYVDLISSSVSLIFSLNQDERTALRVQAGWLYFSMLQDKKDCTEEERDLYKMRIRRGTGISAHEIDRYCPVGFFFENVSHFIETLKGSIDSVMMTRLNEGVFFTALTRNLNSSMLAGINAGELVCIAVEHLPTFVSLTTLSLTEQSFKKTGFGKVVERNFKRDKGAMAKLVNSVDAAVNAEV